MTQLSRFLTMMFAIGALSSLTNCSGVKFGGSDDASSLSVPNIPSAATPATPTPYPQPASPSTPVATTYSGSTLSGLQLHTQLNTPIQFTLTLSYDNGFARAIATDTNGSLTVKTANGLIEILDAQKMLVRYTPNLNFRGNDTAAIYLIQSMRGDGTVSSGSVQIQVDNPLAHLQPALAVRGSTCIMCHASISSNIITDFGYGDPYFFGGPTLQPVDDTSIYADDSTDPSWKYLTALGPQVIVPKAPTTGLTKVGAASLAAYLEGVISNSPNAKVRSAAVNEVQSVYIGAPTADRIRTVGGLTSGVQKVSYAADPGQSTLMPIVNYVTTNGMNTYVIDGTVPLVCSGDLVIDGVLFLNKPVIQTQTGCRIYVTQSVFVLGPIQYLGGNASTQNLQIVSGRSINMGLGRNTCGAAEVGANSLLYRLQIEPRRQFYNTRGEPTLTTQQKLDEIVADANQVGMNNLLDAACEPINGRAVSFQHIILNAPIVFSRYQGNVIGSIVAEVALMSLNTFVFQFDPVFSSNAVLPLLNSQEYLDVQQ